MTNEFSAGDRIGRFEIRRPLGAGGMGSVYLARDTLLDIDVALKFIQPALLGPEAVERFKREVLLARRVTHPNICRIYDLHEEGPQLFYSMEYVQGVTLHAHLLQQGVLPVAQVCRWGLELCSAVEAAHDLGVIHRDLKPGNVLITLEDRVSVLDFGLSTGQGLAPVTQKGVKIGTVCYMAPEVLDDQPATAQSDVYALGVLLYECLTGRLPYTSTSLGVLLAAVHAGSAKSVRELNPEVPEALGQIVARAMAPDLTLRYGGVQELRLALEAVVARLPAADPGAAPAPWHGDIMRSVREVFLDPRASAVLVERSDDSTILFSDIVGITPYFERCGDIAGVRRIKLHNALLFPEIQQRGGRVIKTIGDAIMASFSNPEAGVQAAIAMQQVLDAHNRGSDDQPIEVRIGLHSGASLMASQDVFGNTVNVAARVAARAAGGEILISAATLAGLGSSVERVRFHSEVELKGVSGSTRLHTVDWSGTSTSTKIFKQPSAPVGSPAPAAQDWQSDEIQTQPESVMLTAPARRKRGRLLVAGALAAIALALGAWGWVTWRAAPVPSAPSPRAQQPAPAIATALALAPAAALDAGANGSAEAGEAAEQDQGRGGERERPAPVPARHAARGKRSSGRARAANIAEDVQELRKEINSAWASKGIISGDCPICDATCGRFWKPAQSDRSNRVLESGRSCLEAVKELQIDRKFVNAKILRFNNLLTSLNRETDSAFDKTVLGKLNQNKLVEANSMLNVAFARLRHESAK